MKRFKSILVVCQENCQPDLAIERAHILAKQNGAKVTLVDVVSPRGSEMAEVISDVTHRSTHELTCQLSQYHQRRLNECGKSLRDAGIETRVQVLQGVEFVEVVRAVIRGGYDLVVKAIDPNLRYGGQQIFSGFDMHLMRKCPCPVWVLKDGFDREDLRVLAAVDPDSSDTDKQGLNRLIMELSRSVCPAETGQLHVVHAWKLDEERALLSNKHEQGSGADADHIAQKIQSLREQTLDRLLAFYPDDEGSRQVHLLQGDAGKAIPDFATDNKIDLVVMGTVGRTDVPGMVMGNTAEMVLNRVSCSVLAVKPSDFQTPIELSDPVVDQRSAQAV